VPRLQRFREDLPEIDLRIQTADRDLDLVGEGMPLGIRGGSPGDWPHYECEVLAPEEIYPVCGPGYVARFGRPRALEELAAHRLIHLDEPFRPAVSWQDWFSAVGRPDIVAPKGLRINDYVLVVQSVIEGQGIALGWGHLTDRLVEKGVLVRLTDERLVTGQSFHMAWPKHRPLSSAARAARDWLTDPRNR